MNEDEKKHTGRYLQSLVHHQLSGQAPFLAILGLHQQQRPGGAADPGRKPGPEESGLGNTIADEQERVVFQK